MIVIGSHMIEIERVIQLEVHKELLWRKNHWANIRSRGITSRSAKENAQANTSHFVSPSEIGFCFSLLFVPENNTFACLLHRVRKARMKW